MADAKLCVGAVSRRVIEEAAQFGVFQIVASRRQVEGTRGYTGITPVELVRIVKSLSGGKTQVVRDHGGPHQGWGEQSDDGVTALQEDVAAGFDGLHLDVCRVEKNRQPFTLLQLAERFYKFATLEIGGEHDAYEWNWQLLQTLLDNGISPDWVVIDTGAHIWAERQIGLIDSAGEIERRVQLLHDMGIKAKAHNHDWMFRGQPRWAEQYSPRTGVDAYNLAPEIAQVEIDALLAVLPVETVRTILTYAYKSNHWMNWFNVANGEGTWFDRARCALRYVMNHPDIRRLIELPANNEDFVRTRVRDAIACG